MITTPIGKAFARTENQLTLLIAKFQTKEAMEIVNENYGIRTTLEKIKSHQLCMKEFNLMLWNNEESFSQNFLKEYLHHTAMIMQQLRQIREADNRTLTLDLIDGANEHLKLINKEIVEAQDL